MSDTLESVDTSAPADRSHGRARRRRRRRIVVPLALVAVIGGTGALAVTRPWEGPGTAAARPSVGHGTVVVEKGSLSSGIQVGGALAFDAPTPVVPAGQGTLTALPAVGSVVRAGGKLYEVDGRPVVLMNGRRPLWRDLGPGIPDGPDVAQLERNLVRLGHAEGLGLSVDGKFTKATAVAVKRWQKSLGARQTGTVARGDVVMLPLDSVRVRRIGAQLGSAVGSASVMTVTDTALVAVVRPAENQLSRFKPNGRVTVKLSDGGTVTGRIRSLVRGGSGDGDDQGGSGDSGGGAEKTEVTIALDDQRRARQAGPSSVTVTIVGDTARDALVVPVTALLALDGGGYGVRVEEGAATRLVRVRLGLVADARAQISGDVRAGDRVVVPK
ncbi:peptidoglycan-binding protein [Streptomyces sp. NPDC094032]|uniref:peptidoglycan-binding protein n=1 Tax=Streptomyces sp. NPDC094032 TaxID=3155308 RepID=UPI00332D6047